MTDKTRPSRKRSLWSGPKRRAAGTETLPARPDGAPNSEPLGFARGAKVKRT